MNLSEHRRQAFCWIFAVFVTGLAVLLVGKAEEIKQLPRKSFLCSCRALLLATAPVMVGYAWRGAFKVSLWDRIRNEDPWGLLWSRLGFACFATLGVVLLRNAVTEFYEAAHVDLSDHSFEGGYYQWNYLLMSARAMAVFMAWCWHALAAQAGELTRVEVPELDHAEDWSRGIYAAFITVVFAYTTTASVRWLQRLAPEPKDVLSPRGLAQVRAPTLTPTLTLAGWAWQVHADNSEAYKKTWSDYFKLVGATKGWMIGWAWAGFFEHLLIGRSVRGVEVTQTVYLGLVLLGGGLVAVQCASLKAQLEREDGEHAHTSVTMELHRLMLHTVGMMTGNAVDTYTEQLFPAYGVGWDRIQRAMVYTFIADVIYHLVRRLRKPNLADHQQSEASGKPAVELEEQEV